MVNVDIDSELYEDIKKLIKRNRFNYPSVKFFVQKAVYNEIINSANNSENHDFDKFHLKLREILKHEPELRAKIDEVYSSEIKKVKKGALQ